MSEALPLAGIRVLDISTFIAAPAAAVVLGDYGADVIKVEQPGEGDPNRTTITIASYPKSLVNYPWLMDSRNKRSIALDLKHEAGRAAPIRLGCAPPRPAGAAPALGEHTDEVLREAGLGTVEIAQLRRSGAAA